MSLPDQLFDQLRGRKFFEIDLLVDHAAAVADPVDAAVAGGRRLEPAVQRLLAQVFAQEVTVLHDAVIQIGG